MGLPIPTVTGPLSSSIKEGIVELAKAGRTAKEIAQHLGYSHQFILKAIKEAQEEPMSEQPILVRLPEPWELPASLVAPGMLGPCQAMTVQCIDPTQPGWLQFKGTQLSVDGKDNKLFVGDYILYRTQASQKGGPPYQVKVIIGLVQKPDGSGNPVKVLEVSSDASYVEVRSALLGYWDNWKSPRMVAAEAAAELAVKAIVAKNAGIPILAVHDEVVVNVPSKEEAKKILTDFESKYPDLSVFKEPGPKAKDVPMPVPKVFTGILFTQSGKLQGMTRNEFMAKVGKHGGTFSPTPTAACNIMVMGSGNVSFSNPSTKLKEALSMGIPIISQNTFEQLAKGGKIKALEILNGKFSGPAKSPNLTVISSFFEDSASTAMVVKKKQKKQILKPKPADMKELLNNLPSDQGQALAAALLEKKKQKQKLEEQKLTKAATPVIKKKKRVENDTNDQGLTKEEQELLDTLLKVRYEARMIIASAALNHKEEA